MCWVASHRRLLLLLCRVVPRRVVAPVCATSSAPPARCCCRLCCVPLASPRLAMGVLQSILGSKDGQPTTDTRRRGGTRGRGRDQRHGHRMDQGGWMGGVACAGGHRRSLGHVLARSAGLLRSSYTRASRHAGVPHSPLLLCDPSLCRHCRPYRHSQRCIY